MKPLWKGSYKGGDLIICTEGNPPTDIIFDYTNKEQSLHIIGGFALSGGTTVIQAVEETIAELDDAIAEYLLVDKKEYLKNGNSVH
jgi:hypothetical protein